MRKNQMTPDEFFVLLERSIKATFGDLTTMKAEFAKEREAARIDQQARLEAIRAEADYELRLEVIEALVAKGVSRHVAAERTSTTTGLLSIAEQLGLI